MDGTIEQTWFDKGSTALPPPDLYKATAVAEGLDGWAEFKDEHVDFFHEYGYLVIHDAFTAAEVQAALDGLLDLIDGKYPDFKGLQFEAKARGMLDAMSPEQKRDAIRKVDLFIQYEPRLRAMVLHPRLLAVLARLLGEVPKLLWDQALLKPPLIGREKPWHQDLSMFTLASDTRLIGAWIALDEASLENGCMHIIPGSHREGPVIHFQRRDFQICDTDVATARVVAAPLKPGGCLLFHGLLHHGTPPNSSPLRRRALQCWYTPPGIREITSDEAMAIWGSEGKNVTC